MGKYLKIKMAIAHVASEQKQNISKPCEDYTGKFFNNGVNSIVLADGAGSKKFSATGARSAVKVTGKLLSENFIQIASLLDDGAHKYVAELLIDTIITELKTKRYSEKRGIDQYASTLLFATTDGEVVILGQLGDGGIILSGAPPTLCFKPHSREFANETVFTTSRNAADYFNFHKMKLSDVNSIAIFSDGTEHSLVEKNTRNVAPAFNTMVSWLKNNPVGKVESALEQNLLKSFVPRANDDCSICLFTSY